jgi:SAUR family protein
MAPGELDFDADDGHAGAQVPQGYVPVCVSEEGEPVERFAVRADRLGLSPFLVLLMGVVQE